MEKIGFIGMGNMGYALMKGLLGQFSYRDLIFSCRTENKKEKITSETKVRPAGSNAELANRSKFIILAVKPQVYDEVFAEIKDHVNEKNIIISLAPGKSISHIREKLGESVRVVRAMPNTPALIGCGMTGVAYDENDFSEEEIGVIERLFSSVGKYKKVEESSISAVVCASGSSPAYVYMFINALARASAGKGLPEDVALEMVTEAVKGAAEMVARTGEDPDVLKANVCSKGGTTIAGIQQLDARGFVTSIEAATDACFNRSEELGS